MKISTYLFGFLLLLTALLYASEEQIREALDLANQGKKTEAIQKFQTLATENPNDPRIHLSLGLLYQSTDQDDQAIEQLEQADRLKPSPEASFALGHLYEAKLMTTKNPTYKEKAKAAWQTFLNLAPSQADHRRKVAEKHLRRLEGHDE